jgi:hypothetical protein
MIEIAQETFVGRIKALRKLSKPKLSKKEGLIP